MPGVSIKNFASATGGVYYNGGLPYDASGALLVDGSTVEAFDFANLPDPADVAGSVYFASDLGVDGILLRSNGSIWRPLSGEAILKCLATEITNNAAPQIVMDSLLMPAGLIADNDRLEIYVAKTLSGTDTETTILAHGASSSTVGTSLGLSNAGLASGNLHLSMLSRVKKVSPTSIKPLTIIGSVGLGVTATPSPVVTGLTNMDTTPWYLQVTSDLTTAGGVISTLTEFTVKWIAGT